MKYFSDITKELYETEEELNLAEEKFFKEKIENELIPLKKEIEQNIKLLNNLTYEFALKIKNKNYPYLVLNEYTLRTPYSLENENLSDFFS